eukprot:2281432-Rhodomonas_salina.1
MSVTCIAEPGGAFWAAESGRVPGGLARGHEEGCSGHAGVSFVWRRQSLFCSRVIMTRRDEMWEGGPTPTFQE